VRLSFQNSLVAMLRPNLNSESSLSPSERVQVVD